MIPTLSRCAAAVMPATSARDLHNVCSPGPCTVNNAAYSAVRVALGNNHYRNAPDPISGDTDKGSERKGKTRPSLGGGFGVVGARAIRPPTPYLRYAAQLTDEPIGYVTVHRVCGYGTRRFSGNSCSPFPGRVGHGYVAGTVVRYY